MSSSSRVTVVVKLGAAVAIAIGGSVVTGGGCGPGGHYAVGPAGASGAAGALSEGGGAAGHVSGSGGTGGIIAGTGGAGLGGGGPAGGAAAGNTGTGAATGGRGGGNGGGGMADTGGASSTGGMVGSGGSGGAASGGAGSGGAAGRGSNGSGGAMGGAGGAVLRILSIDFVGGITSGVGGKNVLPTPMAHSEMAGARPAINWNAAPMAMSSTPLTPLLLNDGTSVSASVIWNAPGGPGVSGTYNAGLPDMPGDVRMMNGYLDPAGPLPGGGNNAASITVSGLPSSITTGGYDVYVYFLALLDSGESRSHALKIGSTTFMVSQIGPTTFTRHVLFDSASGRGNYVVFKQVTGSTFTLTSTAISGAMLRAPVNGIQIVWPSGS